MKSSERDLAAALGQALARRIGTPRYNLWFDGRTTFHGDGGVLTVGVPNRHFEEWLEKTFREAVAAAAAEVFGRPMQVRFTIDPALFQAARREQAEAQQDGCRVSGVGKMRRRYHRLKTLRPRRPQQDPKPETRNPIPPEPGAGTG